LKSSVVRLGVNYFDDRDCFDHIASKILFTGCIDEFFDYNLGRLAYRSLRFEHERLEMESYQGNAVVNYNEAAIPFTRIIEHKHFDFGTQAFTLITREYPQPLSPGAEPYYPVNDDRNMRLFSQYKELAASRPDVIFGGRLGLYAYLDMDDAIAGAMELALNELNASL
jgi:UDP-galactopyranose mutase